jgi:hypothetical protein
MANTVVGFSINIDGVQNIDQLNQAIKDTQKSLNGLTVGTEEYTKTAEKLAKLKSEQKGLKKQQDDLNKSFLEQSKSLGSYDQLSAKLNRLRKEYKDLSISGQAASKGGKELLKSIQDIDAQLKETDASVGQFQRNVGNYGQAFQDVAGNLGVVGQTAGRAVGGVRALGLAFKAALGPIGLIIAAIGLVVGSIKAFFTSSEEGQNSLRKLQAIFGVVFNNLRDVLADLGKIFVDIFTNPVESLKAFGNAIRENLTNRLVGILELLPQLGKSIGLLFQGEFQKAGQVALDAVAKVSIGIDNFTEKAQKGFGNVVTGLQNIISETNKEIQQSIELSKIQDNLDKRTRAILIENAKLQQQVADARNKAAQTDKFSNEERLKFLDQAIAAELQILKNNEFIAATKLKIKQVQNSQAKSNKDELLEEAQLEADLINLKTQNLEETKRIVGQRASLIKSLQEEKSLTEKYIEEVAELQTTILDKTNKVLTDLIQNEFDKRRKAADDSFNADVKNIQDSIDNERKANDEKLKDLQEKFGAQSAQVKEFNAVLAEIDKQNVIQLDAFKVEREKLLQKEIEQINKDQIAKNIELKKKEFDTIKAVDQRNFEDQRNLLEKSYNEQLKLAGDNAKEIEKINAQYQSDLFQLEKQRIQDEIDLNTYKINTIEGLNQDEKDVILSQNIKLNADLAKLDADRTKNAIEEGKKRSDANNEQLQKDIDTAGQYTQLALDTVSGLIQAGDEARMKRLEKDAEANAQIQSDLEERLQSATGLERRYLEQQLQANKQTAEQIAQAQEKAEKDAAKKAKAIAIIQSIINTALAISKANTLVPPANIPAMILAGITGAAQTALIAAQPLAKGGVVGKGDDIVQFANGGRVTSRGNIKPLSNGDNVLATLKTGEIVLNESQQRRIGYASLKRAQIPNFANGGLVGAPTSLISNANNSIATEQMRVNLMDEMVKATNQRIDRLTVVYTATTDYEVEKGRNDKKTIKANSTF